MLKAERFAWGVGIIALVVWIAGAGAGRFGTARALDRFDVLRAAAQLSSEEHPDQSLWSPERVKAWEEARKRNSPDPLGVLHIPRLKVVAPVLPGTDDWTLNRGVGHIDDTALLFVHISPDVAAKCIWIAVPLGATSPRAIVIALHGAADRPEWTCSALRALAGPAPFVLCPRGVQRSDFAASDPRYTFTTPEQTASELRAALGELKHRYGAHVAAGSVIFVGVEIGADHAAAIASQEPGVCRILRQRMAEDVAGFHGFGPFVQEFGLQELVQ